MLPDEIVAASPWVRAVIKAIWNMVPRNNATRRCLNVRKERLECCFSTFLIDFHGEAVEERTE